MEVPGGHENKVIVLIYEMIGTALLLIGVNNGVDLGNGSF
jgi:glycerol uptake facilitator-like aquaporin